MTNLPSSSDDEPVIFPHCPVRDGKSSCYPVSKENSPKKAKDVASDADYKTRTEIMELYSIRMKPSLLNLIEEGDSVSSYNPRDDDSSYETEESIPPPPPPISIRERAQFVFSGASDWFVPRKMPPSKEPQADEEIKRDALIIEQGETGIESLDMTKWPSHWSENFKESTNSKENQRHGMKLQLRRWLGLLVFALLVLVSVVALSLGLSGDKTKDQNNANLPGTADASATEAGASPEPVTIGEPAATEEEEGSTVSVCKDLVQSNTDCYEVDNLATGAVSISFYLCNPNVENWIGIYDAKADPDALDNPIDWFWTCNSKSVADCENEGTTFGTLAFANLEEGSYRAHLIEKDGVAPFLSFQATRDFDVKKRC